MVIRDLLDALLDRVWAITLKPSEGIVVHLGDPDHIQPGALFSVVYPGPIWRRRTISQKVGALFRGSWSPTRLELQKAGEETFLDGVFGTDDDFGHDLLKLTTWHGYRRWDFSALGEEDARRAHALGIYAHVTRNQFVGTPASARPPSLRLARRCPTLCVLVYPMVAKVPIIAMRYFIEIQAEHAFSQIRAAGHPEADDIIAYLYDLLFLQQKTALALLEYQRLARCAENKKENTPLTRAEMAGIIHADVLVSYLKASIEKTLALVAAIYSIPHLDSKKTHKAKLDALDRSLPQSAKRTFYCEFLVEMVQSEQLIELNSYRTGLLHKKGVADLQPHKYVSVGPEALPSREVFALLHEQHSRNSAGLLAALAILTDDLVRRAPPADAMAVQTELMRLATEKAPFWESAVHKTGSQA